MKQLSIFLFLVVIIISCSEKKNVKSKAENQLTVVLTYDDGLNVHLDNVIPVLDSLKLKGTFYVPGNSTLKDRLDDWKAIADNGHELGNHTLFHPCLGKSKGREWVNPDYDLDNYSVNRIVTEIKLANTLLNSIDNKTKRTFAYTCGDKTIADSSFVSLIKNEFAGARGVDSGINTIKDLDLFDIKTFSVNGQTANQLIDILSQGKSKDDVITFLFHGVGGEHDLNISLVEHNKFLYYLKNNEKTIKVRTLIDLLN